MKEKKLDINQCIDVRYGTLDSKKPAVIYVFCKSWIKPSVDGDYSLIVCNLMRDMRLKFKNILSSSDYYEKDKFIFDYSLSLSSLTPKKKKYLSFEFYFTQKRERIRGLNELNDSIEEMLSNVLEPFVATLQENTFDMSKGK